MNRPGAAIIPSTVSRRPSWGSTDFVGTFPRPLATAGIGPPRCGDLLATLTGLRIRRPSRSAGSDQAVTDFDVELFWLRKDDDQILPGNWYRGLVAGQPMECWLCPALGLYFAEAPPKLFVRADSLPAGVDPIWRVDPDDPRPRRFVSAR